MANETYECILSGTCAGQFVQSVLHVGVANTADTNPFEIANALLTEFNGSGALVSKYLACLPSNYVMTSMRTRRILTAGGPTAIMLQSDLIDYGGGRSGNAAVSSNSPLIIWLSTLRPSKTGRTFMPGVSSDDIDGNVILAGLLTPLQALGAYWGAGGVLASPAYNWDGQIYRRAIASGDAISNYRISPIIGEQRRRQRPI